MPMVGLVVIPVPALAESPPIPIALIAARLPPVAMRPLATASLAQLPMAASFRQPNRRAIAQRSCLMKSVSGMQKMQSAASRRRGVWRRSNAASKRSGPVMPYVMRDRNQMILRPIVRARSKASKEATARRVRQ